MSRLLGDWIDSFIEYTDDSEPPTLYRKWVAVSVIGACLQRRCWLQWGIDRLFPNLYTVLVGPPGEARKGTAMKMGRIFLDRMPDVNLAADATTREALIRYLAFCQADYGEDGRRAHVHCSMTIYSEELSVFLRSNDQDLLAMLCAWYDCGDTWKYMTKTQGEDFLSNIWVGLLGATTPKSIKESMPETGFGGGFTSRVIFVYADKPGKRVKWPTPLLPEDPMWQQLEKDLEVICTLGGQFKFDDEWAAMWDSWYENHEQECEHLGNKLRHYVTRRQTHLRKLSMIFSASRGDSLVMTGEDFVRAREYLLEAENVMENTFRGMGQSPLSDVTTRVMEYIATQERVLAKDLMNVFYNDASPRIMSEVVQTLKDMNFCKLEYRTGENGQPLRGPSNTYLVYIPENER